MVGVRNANSKIVVNVGVKCIAMQRLNDQEVNVHPDGTSPVVVAETVVGIILRQAAHTVVCQHRRVLSHELVVRSLEFGVVNIQHIQEEWPEVKVAGMAIKLLVAVLVKVKFVEDLSVLIPEVINESLGVGSLLCSVMSFVIGFAEHVSSACKRSRTHDCPGLQVKVSLIISQEGSSWVVVHTRGQTVGQGASTPSEGVLLDIRKLGVLVPVDVSFEIVVNFSQEKFKVVPLLIVEILVVFKSVQQVVDQQVLRRGVSSRA